MAVDIGARRIGFAVSAFGGISVPFTTREVSAPSQAVPAIAAVAKEAEAELVLIGLPLNMDGTEGEMALNCRLIGMQVERIAGLPVRYWDERLSTVSAEKLMIEGDLSRKKRRKNIDKMSAQIFLQSFLDSGGGQ
jgi:putative Holliday junction resolvase